jgi:hypothetical protein
VHARTRFGAKSNGRSANKETEMPESVTQSARNPWKLTAIGIALVAATALVTGVVVASRSKSDDRSAAVQPAPGQPVRAEAPRQAAPAAHASPTRTVASVTAPPRVPDQTVVKACNDHAAAATGPRNKTVEVVKDGAVGAVLGAAVGAAGGAIADGGKGAGKGAAIGGLVGAGAGTLYGVNDNRKHDAAYREAYGSCLRARGYTG